MTLDPDDVAPAALPTRRARREAEIARTAPSGHGHGHSHDSALAASVRTTTRTRVVVLAILIPVLALTVLGAVRLWPAGSHLPAKIPGDAAGTAVIEGTVQGPATKDGLVKVRLDRVGTLTPDPGATGAAATFAPPSPEGTVVTASAPPEMVAYGLKAGQKVRVLYVPGSAADAASTGGAGSGSGSDGSAGPGASSQVGDYDLSGQAATTTPYGLIDFQRTTPIALLAVVLALLVVLVARWRGLAALVGLAVALATIAFFTIPALLEGRNALAVGLVTAVAVMFATLYLAHGFTVRTSTALLGTLTGIAVTGAIAWWASGAASITGSTTDESLWIPSYAHHVSLAGIALCGMILAGLGALNDVTITQASSVWELRALAPEAPRRTLFTSALRIGHDHIASTVYTIVFAYLGASLPLLLGVWLAQQPLSLSLSTGSIAEEIVRTLVGAIGLVLAIPLTTAIAAMAVPSQAAAPVDPVDDAEAREIGAPLSSADAIV